MVTQIVLIKDGELDFNIDNIQDQFVLSDIEKNHYTNIANFLKKDKIKYFYCDGSKRSLQIYDIVQQEQQQEMKKEYVSSYLKISKQILKQTSMFQFMNNIRMLVSEIIMTEKKFVVLVANGYIINQIAYYLFQMQKNEDVGKWSFYNGQYNTLKLVYENPNVKKADNKAENAASTSSTQNIDTGIHPYHSQPNISLSRHVTNPDLSNVIQSVKRPATTTTPRQPIKYPLSPQEEQIKPRVQTPNQIQDKQDNENKNLETCPINFEKPQESKKMVNYTNIKNNLRVPINTFDVDDNIFDSGIYKDQKDRYTKMHISSLESFLNQTKREQQKNSISNKRVSAYSPTRVYYLTEQNQCSQYKIPYGRKQYNDVNTSILKILKDKQIIK